jgi:hypothetical protein
MAIAQLRMQQGFKGSCIFLNQRLIQPKNRFTGTFRLSYCPQGQ